MLFFIVIEVPVRRVAASQRRVTEKRKIVIETPPQTGKSTTVKDKNKKIKQWDAN